MFREIVVGRNWSRFLTTIACTALNEYQYEVESVAALSRQQDCVVHLVEIFVCWRFLNITLPHGPLSNIDL
jgi:hypothetical protein